MSRYRYAVLDPRHVAEGVDLLEGEVALGIEVTIPQLASACSLGNIDPQHSGTRSSAMAAVDAALACPLPPRGALLVTVRPDLDALAAMALLELRSVVRINDGVVNRISAVSTLDRGPTGPWKPDVRDTSFDVDVVTAAMFARDSRIPLERRVSGIRTWLSKGVSPTVMVPRNTDVDVVFLDSPSEVVAVVKSTSPLAVRLGYERAPVVIAENPCFRLELGAAHRKITVAQWQEAWADLGSAAKALEGLEPGWGGTPTVIGSPQGIGTALELGTVTQLVVHHLRRTAL